MRRKSRREQQTTKPDGIQSERLDPVRVIERELTRPDGTTLKVRVPVYPPFELKKRSPIKAEKTARKLRKTA